MPSAQLETTLLGIATTGYAGSWLLYVLALRPRFGYLAPVASHALSASLLVHLSAFVGRWIRSGHVPFYSGHEFSAAFAGGIVLLLLVFERLYRRRDLGTFILPVAIAWLVHAWTMPREVEPLIPIFQSLWLTVHIGTAFVAYAAFAVTFGASCLYFTATRRRRSNRPDPPMASLNGVDRIAYRSATLGFSFLTACIISGAIWAELVWGRFWSWDPKETWSLITWLVFAAYLHARYHRGWNPRQAALLGIMGFLLVVVTYIGVDYVSPRQHSFLFWERS